MVYYFYFSTSLVDFAENSNGIFAVGLAPQLLSESVWNVSCLHFVVGVITSYDLISTNSENLCYVC